MRLREHWRLAQLMGRSGVATGIAVASLGFRSTPWWAEWEPGRDLVVAPWARRWWQLAWRRVVGLAFWPVLAGLDLGVLERDIYRSTPIRFTRIAPWKQPSAMWWRPRQCAYPRTIVGRAVVKISAWLPRHADPAA